MTRLEWTLHQLAPGAQWSIIGDELVWHDVDIPQPTPAEIDAKIAEYSDYQQKREKAILEKWPIAQQFEAHAEAAEDPPRIEKLNALLADIAEIKLLYPKP